MNNISIDEILCLRRLRYKIVQICELIYQQNWSLVDENMEKICLEYTKILPKDCEDTINQCRICMQKRNAIRLRDLLLQEVDFSIINQLFMVGENDRKILTEKARKDNEEALMIYHKNVWRKVCNINSKQRIECDFVGTENVDIIIKGNEQEFRLFSIVNPWQEANNLVDNVAKRVFDQVYVLGFGGGFLIGELQRRFPNTKIKVYLPNMDIFYAVLQMIPIGNILRNNNLEFCCDPTCLLFLVTISELLKKNEKIGICVDRQELKASMADPGVFDYWFRKYETACDNSNTGKRNEIETVGKRIVRDMNDLAGD